MSQKEGPFPLPKSLPVPRDDGACDHLRSMKIPLGVRLPSTRGRLVEVGGEINSATSGRVVFFFYPRTGTPGIPLPQGWDQIPGARGCTPESCSYRDLYSEFKRLGSEVFGISTQTNEEQREFASRSNIPYEILSDSKLELSKSLRLPTFSVPEVPIPMIKRLTLVSRYGTIEKVFYPVFPPDKNAEQVLSYLGSSS
jgi:peroxiredoxin